MELGFYGNLEIEMIREGIRKERASEIANKFREKLVTLKQVKLADDKILEEMIDQLGIKDAIDFKKVKTILDEMKGPSQKTLYEHLSTTPTELLPGEALKRSSSSTESTSIKAPFPTLYNWPNFNQHFKDFKEAVKLECKDRSFNPIKFTSTLVISNEDQVKSQFYSMSGRILDPILNDNNFIIGGADTKSKTFGDVFVHTLDGTESHYICELKAKLPHYKVVDVNQPTPQIPEIRAKNVKIKNQQKIVKRVYVDLVNSDRSFENFQFTSSGIKAATIAIQQVMSNARAMRHKATQEYRLFYSMLSTVEITFLFFNNKKENLFFSQPIEREDFFFSMYFILLLRYPVLIPCGARQLRVLIDHINSTLNSVSDELAKSDGIPPTIIDAKKSSRTGSQTEAACFSGSQLYDYYLEDSEIIFGNENVRVAKFEHQGKFYVIKCCEVYKSPKHANVELEHEVTMLSKISEKNKIPLEFLPKFVCSGRFLIFNMLVTEFINGECYFEFDEMSFEEKKACQKSLQQLHSLGVLHGDVRAPNFIIRNAKTSNPLAVVIDFGRSRFQTDKILFKKEMEFFCNEANLKPFIGSRF